MRPESPLQWHEPKHVVKNMQRVFKVLRGNISYGNMNAGDTGRNIDGFPATATTPAVANTEFSVNHGLGRVPVGFHVVNKDGSTDVYKGTTAWTSSKIFLKSTGINIHITLFIF